MYVPQYMLSLVALQRLKQIQKSHIEPNFGSGLVGPGLTRKKEEWVKSSQNSPMVILICRCGIKCVF